MKFNIAGFTHKGTEREMNQDRILIQNLIYENGAYNLLKETYCFCFVADGIGGGPSGEKAAQYILEQINLKLIRSENCDNDCLAEILNSINIDLFSEGRLNLDYLGSGSTLVGLMISDNYFKIINAGDSQAWLFRNNIMTKLTEDQVLDSQQENSPIISYFGGNKQNLKLNFDTILRNIKINDILILTSDGLLKSLTIKQIKSILSNSKSLIDKTEFILQKALLTGAEDNVSCIFIEVIN
ncbi:MAG: serine/threonine-protein phosphatase [Candidatus Cloacimonadales bacterium]|nr:serine/threonine-protein phosphatase [Candidatus Cloacimonadales bacterium]